MFKSLNSILFVVSVLAIVAIGYLLHRTNTLKEQLSASKINELAYIAENDSLKNKSIQFQYTISELNNSNDSLVREMMDVRKQLDVKTKELLSLSYLSSTTVIHDSLIVIDTIFVKETKIDTTIHNKWYDISLGLSYPNLIDIGIKVPSEKYIIASYNKVLLEPTGCKFKDLFKKKSKIVEVEVLEKNPYIINNKQKFIEVIR